MSEEDKDSGTEGDEPDCLVARLQRVEDHDGGREEAKEIDAVHEHPRDHKTPPSKKK